MVIVESRLIPDDGNLKVCAIFIVKDVLSDFVIFRHVPESAGLEEMNGLKFLVDWNADLIGAMAGPNSIEGLAIPIGASRKFSAVEPDDSPDVEFRIADRLEFFGDSAPIESVMGLG